MYHHPAHFAVYVCFAQTITREDLRQLRRVIYPEDARQIHRISFVDFSGIERADIGFREFLWLSHEIGDERRANKIPIRIGLHAPGGVAYGLARIFEQVMQLDGLIEVFVHETRSNVPRWLELPDLALLSDPIDRTSTTTPADPPLPFHKPPATRPR